MRIVLIALIFLLGLLDLFMAVSFLLTPAETGQSFGLTANGAQGLSSLRADFTALFGVTAGCMMLGAWRRNGDLLLVPAALMGSIAVIRLIGLALDGPWPAWQVSVGVEVTHVVLLVFAWRILPHHRIEELTS